MNPPGDKERLLADVLADENAAGFRDALLSETLGLVRRRRRSAAGVAGNVRRWRLSRHWACWCGESCRRPRLRRGREAGYAVVVSRPLPLAAVVVSQPVGGRPYRRIRPERRRSSRRPRAGRQCREIDDSELLALVGPKPAALVRLAPHSAELVFVNPADEEELFRN